MAQPLPALSPDLENADEKAARLAWVRARLDEAEDDIANGRYIEGDEAIRWLENEIAEVSAEFERDE